jgi:hypothetical protein
LHRTMYRFSEMLAWVAGIVLPVGETLRRWGTWWDVPPAYLDDLLIGAFLRDLSERSAAHDLSVEGRRPFAVPAGGTVSVVALILIAWLFSSSSWRELLQASVAGAVGLLFYALLAMSWVWNQRDSRSQT